MNIEISHQTLEVSNNTFKESIIYVFLAYLWKQVSFDIGHPLFCAYAL